MDIGREMSVVKCNYAFMRDSDIPSGSAQM